MRHIIVQTEEGNINKHFNYIQSSTKTNNIQLEKLHIKTMGARPQKALKTTVTTHT